MRILRIALFILIPVILLIISSSWIMEWLWLRELGYSEVFRVLKGTRILLFFAAFLLAAVYLVINFRYLARKLGDSRFLGTIIAGLNLAIPAQRQQKWIRNAATVLALFIALIFALAFMFRWDDALRFLWTQPFGSVDPVFGRDISFYMFQLPLLSLLQGSITALTFITTLLLAVAYFATDMVSARPNEGLRAEPGVLGHIKVNLGLWLLSLSASFYLSRYELLFREDGVVFGAGYTHLAIELPALWIATILTILLALLVLLSRWVRMTKVIAGTAILLVLVLIGGRLVLPSAVQQLRVNPNELEIERPYIEKNIEMTRLAFGLDRIREVDYPADDTLRAGDIRQNQTLIENIRLWDPRLLIQTYRQLQEIRPYYQFNTIGIDRYIIDGQKQQVMLAGRELAPQLPDGSNTWVNRHLQYTHGYGVAMSPVTRANRQGEPLMLARDLPPVTHPDIPIDNPAIYYGKQSEGYVIVNSGTEELHYPAGAGNVYHHYEGTGGIPFRSWFYRLLFAWELGDINILLSDYIHPESRLQIWRSVQDRIERITPFLTLDEDPYLVVYDGRLVWIQDAYTTSSKFPYSEPFGRINYIRNPVKIVVDAYDGTVDYYVIDEQDPVIAVYMAIFPDLFQRADSIPPGLDNHFRYPVNLFEVQMEQYSRYHMTNPRVFYNDEDRWRRPFEQYGGRRLLMEPYYVLGRLPGEENEELEFKLISPFTPEGRNNMIAWMAARSDPEHYGELVTYRLPKDRLIYGPAQIESRIDQDPEISRQLALWDQRGSRVIRGNLLVVPVANSFMYVEPVFLLADRDDIPQLQRVIVAIGDDISMQPTIEAALVDLFGDEADFLGPSIAPETIPDEEALIAEMEEPLPVQDQARMVSVDQFDRLRSLWRDMRQAMQDGNWSRYGELMEEMEELLDTD
ncbi:UPF0182 family protein [Balneolales bacterium ANBcel1]|nr:UPF0182 family protein [Balneolales bacterium ANBcel1]